MRKGLALGIVIGALVTGGGALAASHYLITSTRQIKPSVLKHLRGERGQRGPAGSRGAVGNAGPAGPAGPAGMFSTANVVEVNGPPETMCASGGGSCQVAGSLAACPPGGVAIGGGWAGDDPSPNATVDDSNPLQNVTWDVVMTNNSTLTAAFHAVVVCAVSSGSLLRRASRGDLAAEAARAVAVARR